SATSILIAAGQMSGSITLTGKDDGLDEPDEVVTVSITGATNATPGTPASVSVAIADDDPPPTVDLSASPASLAENGGTTTVTAPLSPVSRFDVPVNLGFTATATGSGTDYTASGNSIMIPAGQTTGSVTLSGTDDALDEPDETVIVSITGAGNAT